MTDLPNPAQDGDADATTPETGSDTTEPVVDVAPTTAEEITTAVPTPVEVTDTATTDTATTDTATTDTPPTSENGVEPVPVLPVVTDVEPAPRRRRRSLALRFGAAFVIGFALMAAIGGGVLYAWGREYDGRVLPGVSVGSTDLGGLTREQAASKLASDYASLGSGEIMLNGPDGQMSTISYSEVARGPDTTSLVDAALAAGRHDDPIMNLIRGPQAAINGATLDSAVTYDRSKLAAAVDSLATTLDQTPIDAFVSPGQNGTYSVSPAKDGRAVDKAALLTALDQQLVPLAAPASITMAVPIVSLAASWVATASAETAQVGCVSHGGRTSSSPRGDDSWTIEGKSLAPLISVPDGGRRRRHSGLRRGGHASRCSPILWPSRSTGSAQDAGLRMNERTRGRHRQQPRGANAQAPARTRPRLSRRSWPAESGAPASKVAAIVQGRQAEADHRRTPRGSPARCGSSARTASTTGSIVNNHFGGNIEAPATKINGTVVPAGGVFDFWKVVGDLRKLPGTGPGNAIEGGKITVTGAFGGGICTTSTTLFNAAFRAGMVPMARKNHNEFITRYPPGLDATVWIVGNVKQTMSFRNDTKYPIMIHADRDPGRQQALAQVQHLERAERAGRQGHQHGHPARAACDRHGRAGSEQARGLPLPQQRPGGRGQGVGHRVDLRPRQAPLE